jgi:hypothetical protein
VKARPSNALRRNGIAAGSATRRGRAGNQSDSTIQHDIFNQGTKGVTLISCFLANVTLHHRRTAQALRPVLFSDTGRTDTDNVFRASISLYFLP